ncbi:MAG TPA: peptide chain release factor 1 [Clostridia bacterium]|nr:peptide chain release factor 1 [Clostridia bacterium]
MREKLDKLLVKYEELSKLIGDPHVMEDMQTWQKYVKEHSDLMPIVDKYTQVKRLSEELEGANELFESSDDEMKELARLEIDELEENIQALEEEIKLLLIPKDPNDKKDVIVEIRAGAGGDEAGLFAGELMRMYMRYAEDHRWKAEIIDISETNVGGIKEASMQIKGKGAYSKLKFESGTHRVQRVPETESGGRIHTSTATVAVLPEADEVDVEIHNNDLRIDVYRSSGHGGQSVNTSDSAVRITHLPSGMVVTCQDGKSQQMNKEQALRVLRARLYDKMRSEQSAAIAQERKMQIGTGDRSAKIRTYNYPQSRITDHRINFTVYQLESFLMGDIDEMVEALATNYQAQLLQES